MSVAQTITLDAQKVLTFAEGILPILEQSVPAVAAAGGPIGMGVSAAALAIPLVQEIIGQISAQGTIDTTTQQARLDAVNQAFTDFHGANWQVSQASAPITPPTAPPTAPPTSPPPATA